MGSLEHKIVPTAEMANKLAKILENHVTGETLDIIWGPDLKCTVIEDVVGEEYTDIITITRPEENV
jgi:hypothetical protein